MTSQMRTVFINKVAPPIANKMFDWGLIPYLLATGRPTPVASDSSQWLSMGVNFRRSIKQFRREIPWEIGPGHDKVLRFMLPIARRGKLMQRYAA